MYVKKTPPLKNNTIDQQTKIYEKKLVSTSKTSLSCHPRENGDQVTDWNIVHNSIFHASIGRQKSNPGDLSILEKQDI